MWGVYDLRDLANYPISSSHVYYAVTTQWHWKRRCSPPPAPQPCPLQHTPDRQPRAFSICLSLLGWPVLLARCAKGFHTSQKPSINASWECISTSPSSERGSEGQDLNWLPKIPVACSTKGLIMHPLSAAFPALPHSSIALIVFHHLPVTYLYSDPWLRFSFWWNSK